MVDISSNNMKQLAVVFAPSTIPSSHSLSLFKSRVQARISLPFRTGMHNYPTVSITIIRHNTIRMTLPTNAKREGRIQVSCTNIHHLTKAQLIILLYSFETASKLFIFITASYFYLFIY
jgi:hypothetical protein